MATTDIQWRIKQAAADAIRSLGMLGDDVFTGIGDRVYSYLFPDETGCLFPCVQLTSEGEREERDTGDTEQLMWRYPVRIFIADIQSARSHEKERLYMMWRKAIIRMFDQPKVNPLKKSIPELSGTEIVPNVVFDPALPQYQHIISGVVMWAITTESRYEE